MDQFRSPERRLRIFLRDFRLLDAIAMVGDGQSLASWLAHRRNYVNVRDARWTGSGENMGHAVLRVDQVLWVAAPDRDVPVTHAAYTGRGRLVEMQLDGGLVVRAGLIMSPQQRLTDHLEAAGPFVALLQAVLLRSGRPPRTTNVHLGDVVLNQAAIQAVWEVDPALASEPPVSAAAPATVPEELGQG